MKPPLVELQPLDDPVIEALLAVAVADAEPEEVMAPVAGPPGWTEPRRQAFRAYHRSRRAGLDGPHAELTLLVRANGKPVGAARLERVASGTLEAGVWLRRSARGRGIGSDLLRALIATAAATGAETLIAETTASNGAALAALRRCGARLGEPGAYGVVRAELPLQVIPA